MQVLLEFANFNFMDKKSRGRHACHDRALNDCMHP